MKLFHTTALRSGLIALALAVVSQGAFAASVAQQNLEHPELALLTPRQRQILQLIAEGYATREIAERLFLSIKTVETHRSQLMDRLGIYDVAGLVRLAIRTGMVTPEH